MLLDKVTGIFSFVFSWKSYRFVAVVVVYYGLRNSF